MTEKEYINATDLARLRMVDNILRDCLCMEMPNKQRLRSVSENVRLMVDDLFEEVDIKEKL